MAAVPEDESAPPPASPAPRSGLILMAIILVAMALLSVYSNVQRARRDQIETVTITPAASPASSATPTATP
ncbi:MAG: hypothetical protein M3Y80_10135 [Verrucomicrobiota bacterium]|nr:hypothetical protein [Verrucomicrobiota bacterium]